MILKGSKLCLVNAKRVIASECINEDESSLHHDCEHWLAKPISHQPVSQYCHNSWEDNADAPLKRQIMGREEVAITSGKLPFGTREQVFQGKYDGRQDNADRSGSWASKGGLRF